MSIFLRYLLRIFKKNKEYGNLSTWAQVFNSVVIGYHSSFFLVCVLTINRKIAAAFNAHLGSCSWRGEAALSWALFQLYSCKFSNVLLIVVNFILIPNYMLRNLKIAQFFGSQICFIGLNADGSFQLCLGWVGNALQLTWQCSLIRFNKFASLFYTILYLFEVQLFFLNFFMPWNDFGVINQVAYGAALFSILFIFWQPCVSVKLLYLLEFVILDR